MIQREKRYVEVDVRFSTEGRLRPLQIIFDNLHDSRQRVRIMV